MTLRVIRGWERLDDGLKGGALALGNFDGVHRGHRRVIEDALAAARRLGAPGGVISFEPHPRRYFQPDSAGSLSITAE